MTSRTTTISLATTGIEEIDLLLETLRGEDIVSDECHIYFKYELLERDGEIQLVLWRIIGDNGTEERFQGGGSNSFSICFS